MSAHFIIVNEQAERSDEPAYYGPYATKELADEALEGNPNADRMTIVGIDPLHRTIDPTAMHPDSGG
jgi:hypothetical protein